MSARNLTVLKPLTIDDAVLIASDVPETDYAEWVAEATYVLGDRIIDVAGHKIYESIQNANSGRPPPDEPLFWAEVGPTNRWRAFDTANSTATAQAGSISYTLRPNAVITTLAALNLAGVTSIRIQFTHPVYGSMYDETIDLSSLPAAPDWWSWFFGQRSAPTQYLNFNLPGVPGADMQIDFAGTDELAVGVLLIGQPREFGFGVVYGTKFGIRDYSRNEANDFGERVLVRRNYAKTLSCELVLAKAEVDPAIAFFSGLRATPCLWVVTDEFEAATIFGTGERLDVLISYPDHADCQLELLGMT